MLIKEILETHVIKIDKDKTWLDVLHLMEDHNTNCLYVVDAHEKLLGIVSVVEIMSHVVPPYMRENPGLAKSALPDAFVQLCEKIKHHKVKEFMSPPKPVFLPDTNLLEIAANSITSGHYRLPVVDEHGKFLGVVNRRHIREALAKHLNH